MTQPGVPQHITVGKGITVHLGWLSGRYLPFCNPGIASKGTKTHLTEKPITCKRCVLL